MSRPKLDKYHYHEMLDRLSIVMSMVNDHLLQHPVCKLEKKVTAGVDEALTNLYNAYQECGKISLKKSEDEN